MPLVLAHVTGATHLHGDVVAAVFAILIVLAVGLASSRWSLR